MLFHPNQRSFIVNSGRKLFYPGGLCHPKSLNSSASNNFWYVVQDILLAAIKAVDVFPFLEPIGLPDTVLIQQDRIEERKELLTEKEET
ncbi:hypothetical protein J0S82_004201, partial [Galemys pyrenaicus]